MQRAASPRPARLAEFDAAIARAEWRVRWCRLVLGFRVALGCETYEAREWLSLEESHLARLREDRHFLAHADEGRRGRVASAG